MFCPECHSMMFPINGVYTCRKCSKQVEIDKGKAQTFSEKNKDNEMAVINDSDAALPKTKIICPQCSHNEAFFSIRQTRAADEPETRFYRCCKCNYNWRVY